MLRQLTECLIIKGLSIQVRGNFGLRASAIGMAVFLKILRSADIEKTKHEFIKRLTQRFVKEDIKLA